MVGEMYLVKISANEGNGICFGGSFAGIFENLISFNGQSFMFLLSSWNKLDPSNLVESKMERGHLIYIIIITKGKINCRFVDIFHNYALFIHPGSFLFPFYGQSLNLPSSTIMNFTFNDTNP